MSRVAKNPVKLPAGVQVNLAGRNLSVKGPKGQLSTALHRHVEIEQGEGQVAVRYGKPDHARYAGTTRSLLANMVTGVTTGFERKLELVGVGYRAQAQGKKLNLTLGFSHPVEYAVPDGITIETPSQTEILVKGVDKQLVGQVAANIRRYRPPEPYKGKGVRYASERVVLKEAKKK